MVLIRLLLCLRAKESGSYKKPDTLLATHPLLSHPPVSKDLDGPFHPTSRHTPIIVDQLCQCGRFHTAPFLFLRRHSIPQRVSRWGLRMETPSDLRSLRHELRCRDPLPTRRHGGLPIHMATPCGIHIRTLSQGRQAPFLPYPPVISKYGANGEDCDFLGKDGAAFSTTPHG